MGLKYKSSVKEKRRRSVPVTFIALCFAQQAAPTRLRLLTNVTLSVISHKDQIWTSIQTKRVKYFFPKFFNRDTNATLSTNKARDNLFLLYTGVSFKVLNISFIQANCTCNKVSPVIDYWQHFHMACWSKLLSWISVRIVRLFSFQTVWAIACKTICTHILCICDMECRAATSAFKTPSSQSPIWRRQVASFAQTSVQKTQRLFVHGKEKPCEAHWQNNVSF